MNGQAFAMKRVLKSICAAAVCGAASAAIGQTPPAYTPVRWNEDYSYLKDPSAHSDPFDPIKYIPLGGDGFYLSTGGQIRERYEYFNHNNFGAGAQDENGFTLNRILLDADLHLGPNLRVFAQGKSSLENGREGGPRQPDEDQADIQQLFFDITIPLPTGPKDSTTFRVGRQDLIYGAQRLISPLDWTNDRRTFEGFKLSTAIGHQTIDAFYVRPVLIEAEELNRGDDDANFWGVYDTISCPDLIAKGSASKVEGYFLGLNKRKNTTTPVDSDTYTIGARVYTNPKPWDLDIEGDYQFGQSGAGNISAYSLAAEGGYTLENCEFTPRFYLGFDIASGDQNPNNPNSQTFNQLFPLGHAYFGYIDVIGRQNIIDLHPGVESTLLKDKTWAKKVSLRADYHMFWRQSIDDAVYSAAGGVQRADNGSDASTIGQELDLLLNWQIERHTLIYVGYSHFFAGSFIQQTGPSQDIDFFYAAAVFTF
jgi:hypothetical protein